MFVFTRMEINALVEQFIPHNFVKFVQSEYQEACKPTALCWLKEIEFSPDGSFHAKFWLEWHQMQ